ncbi:MAG: hypothetical protein SFV24_02435 [Gemmatimonadales bacterium]|nr:hypothetical protein [Gemmatimonadales bacterium]
MRLASAVVLAAVVAIGGTGFTTGASRADWTFLGQRQVSDRADHDVITVTGAEGKFSAIQIRVLRAPVDFHRVQVHFRNGGKQEVELRNTIPAGGESRRIDLEGDDRVIRSVEFWYDARTIRGRRAVVRLFGQP